MSGHKSDAVDCYAITSDEQREKLSRIIAGTSLIECQNVQNGTINDRDNEKSSVDVVESDESNQQQVKTVESETQNYSETITPNNVGEVVTKIMKCCKGKGKIKIKMELEICSE